MKKPNGMSTARVKEIGKKLGKAVASAKTPVKRVPTMKLTKTFKTVTKKK